MGVPEAHHMCTSCRLSPSGMSRQSTSGELDVEGPLHAQREGSPASRSSEAP